jgi:hypothetical protein
MTTCGLVDVAGGVRLEDFKLSTLVVDWPSKKAKSRDLSYPVQSIPDFSHRMHDGLPPSHLDLVSIPQSQDYHKLFGRVPLPFDADKYGTALYKFVHPPQPLSDLLRVDVSNNYDFGPWQGLTSVIKILRSHLRRGTDIEVV